MHKLLYPLTAFLLAGSLFAADPFAGTWKENIAKSKFGGPNQAPKEATVVIEEHGDQAAVSVKGTGADGSPISVKYTVVRTGGEAAKFSEGGPPAGVSVVYAKKKADARSLDTTTTRDGKVIETSHGAVGTDGKTFTITSKGTDPQGKLFETVQIYERQ
jgi:hypothetical protein